MKVYKLEVLITDYNEDFSNYENDAQMIKAIVEETRHPNHCMSPKVLNISTVDLGM
jgi:hypothetical protein